uniref:KIB1-4 beta-propeller domain-containing protein n=1 Tax=Oryza punctata TaxID=4537 RepID=A0A0E0MHC7_ORYPU
MSHHRPCTDGDKLALAVAHVAFPDGELFTFPDLEHHGDGDGEGDSDTTGYLAACGDRLLFADDEYDVLRLTSPLTGNTVMLPGLVDGVRVLDVPVVVANEAAPSGTAPRRWRESEEMSVLKLVVCPGGCGLVAAIVGREHFAKVALCTPEGFVWSISAHDRWRWYDDMAFHGGRLYALTQAEDLLAFDVGYADQDGGEDEPVVTGVERVVRSSVDALDEETRMHYLVTSLGGALLMVRREMPDAGSTDGFEVFEADLAASRWVEVDRLDAGGEALFVGRLCSRAVRAPDDADQIFFLDDTDGLSFRWELQPRPPYQVAAYDMVRRTFSMLMWKKPLEDGDTPVTWLFPDDDDDDKVTK